MKNLLLSVAALAIIGAGCVSNTPAPQQTQNTNTPPATEQPMVGNDRDEHGCIGSAGYSWCAAKNKCIRIWEETCSTTTVDLIRDALAAKYEKKISDVSVTISKQEGNFAKGNVAFAPGGSENSGMFLAHKSGDIWKIAYDGNGNADCTALQNLGFPKTILTGICF